ncbi:hypothetical protein [Haloarchaeobius baliensis]|uniref:hypothetical protein n=1 Tax=Haloarchaeobius baliensis TaxID=1670458 RepID=UPI003F88160B
MSKVHRISGVALVLLVATATVTVQGALPVTALADTNSAETPTEIAACQEITSAGTYVLTEDITTSAETCVNVSADDVTIDGNGHEIATDGWDTGPTAIVAEDVTNVTVRDVGFRNWDDAIRFQDTDGEIRNVTAGLADSDRGGTDSILLKGEGTVTVVDSDLEQLLVKTLLGPVDLHARNNTVESGLSLSGATGVVENNTIDRASLGTYTHDVVFRHNDVVEAGLTVRGGDNITVTENHIQGPTANDDAVTLVNVGENFELTRNVVEDASHGVRISGNEGSITVAANDVRNTTTGILVENVETDDRQPTRCDRSAWVSDVDIHGNAISTTGGLGIDNRADGWVDADRNYWGSSDGPSSPGSTTLMDPVTGQPADGSGAAVSTWESHPAYTNVHFHDALAQEPEPVPTTDEVGVQTG